MGAASNISGGFGAVPEGWHRADSTALPEDKDETPLDRLRLQRAAAEEFRTNIRKRSYRGGVPLTPGGGQRLDGADSPAGQDSGTVSDASRSWRAKAREKASLNAKAKFFHELPHRHNIGIHPKHLYHSKLL